MKMKVTVTTVANTDIDSANMFEQTLTPTFRTQFGLFGGNIFPLADCPAVNQFTKNIIDIPEAAFPLSPRQGIIIPVVPASVTSDFLRINLLHWVEEFTRTSAGE
jgi:hypothetical protein